MCRLQRIKSEAADETGNNFKERRRVSEEILNPK